MTTRALTRWAIGSSVAAALCATTLSAQVDTTTRRDTARARVIDSTRTRTTTTGVRSTTRIPIRKESRGEVMMPARPNADSIARAAEQARNDSIMNANKAREDSIAAAEAARVETARNDSIARVEQARNDSIARVEQMRNDSIARATPPATATVTTEQNMGVTRRKLPGSFYMGLAAGASSPMGDYEDFGYGSGLNISVPFGWHSPSKTLGFRVMLAYNQFSGSPFSTGGVNPVILTNPDPKVYSAELNLNARFPFNERRTSSVYLTGGGGVYMFRNYGQGSALAGYLGNDVLDPNDSNNESTINKWGVNGGAGLEFGIGTSALFLETRLVNVFAGRNDEPNFDSVFGERGTSVRWVPLILGFTIR